jgi:hypothetical protein
MRSLKQAHLRFSCAAHGGAVAAWEGVFMDLWSDTRRCLVIRSIAFGSGRRGVAARLVALLLLPVVAGCGPGQGKVTGRVLYDGKPLPGGRVTFMPEGAANPVTVMLDEQGNYEAVLPTGEVKVSVDNHELEPRPTLPTGIPPGLPGGAAAKLKEAMRQNPQKASGAVDPRMHDKLPGKYVPIPKKYFDYSKSGISFTVQRGDMKHDIELPK